MACDANTIFNAIILDQLVSHRSNYFVERPSSFLVISLAQIATVGGDITELGSIINFELMQAMQAFVEVYMQEIRRGLEINDFAQWSSSYWIPVVTSYWIKLGIHSYSP